jgi:MFS family permease
LAAVYDVGALQRRTVGVLVGSQALGGLGNTVGITVAALLAEEVSGSEALAGLVQTMQVLGAALASYLLSRLMGARGRRPGLVAGYLVGSAGAAVCVLGGALGAYPLLLVGGALLGANSATNYQARYAAADLATPLHRARALSLVLWATTFGAVLGPNLVGPAGDLAEWLSLPLLTGPFVVSVVVVLAGALVIAAFLRPDPLLVAREVAVARVVAAAGPPGSETRPGAVASWRRVRQLAGQHPGIAGGIIAMAAAHAVMVAVMMLTPLHMHGGGAELEVIGFVISVHILGMYFFSPGIGVLADRWGRSATLLSGAVVLWGSLWLAGTAPMGASVRIGVALFLLGLGWSFCTVSASALLTDATPLDARTDVQGIADMLMNVAAAAAGLLAGVVVEVLGFGALNVFAAILVVGVLGAVAASRRDPATV